MVWHFNNQQSALSNRHSERRPAPEPQIDALRFPSGCLRQSVSLRSADELGLLIFEV
jgi:hypothetical protein